MPSAEASRKIIAAAHAGPDAKPLPKAQMQAMVPLKALRGRPRSADPKQLVSVRCSPEELACFKGRGEGWQSRMNGVLEERVSSQGARRMRKAT
jgi:uncharacterized protein (DUF4415 family)